MAAALKLLDNGEVDKAMEIAKEDLEKCKKKNDQKGQVSAMVLQVEVLVVKNKGDEALSLASEAVALAKKTGDTKLETQALNASVGAHLLKDAGTAALKAANNALALAQQSGDKEGEASAWLQMASVHLSKDGADQNAMLDVLQAAEKATDLFKGLKDEAGEARARGVVASAQLKLGNVEEAVQAANHSLKLWKGADNARRANDALGMLVQAHGASGNAREGMRVAKVELEDAQGSKDERRLAGTLQVVASANLAAGDAAEAFRCAKQARGIYRTLGDSMGEGWATYAVAEAQQAQGSKLEAMKSTDEALKLFKDLGSAEGVEATNSLVSELYASIGKVGKAPDRKKALAALRELNKAVENKDVEAFNTAKNKAEALIRFVQDDDTMDALAPAFEKDPRGTADFLKEQGWEVQEGDGEKTAQKIKHFDHQSFYAFNRTVGGMGFGPQFRSTNPYRVGTVGVDAVALSCSCLPETEDWEMKMGFRPGIIDSGLQATGTFGFP